MLIVPSSSDVDAKCSPTSDFKSSSDTPIQLCMVEAQGTDELCSMCSVLCSCRIICTYCYNSCSSPSKIGVLLHHISLPSISITSYLPIDLAFWSCFVYPVRHAYARSPVSALTQHIRLRLPKALR